MSCPTCDHTMHSLGHSWHWCPRCGTIAQAYERRLIDIQPPKLVERCRAFEGGLRKPPRDADSWAEAWNGLQTTWHALGIAESIWNDQSPPQERPT